MTSKWGHAKVAGSGPTSVVTLGNLIECLSPLIKTNNNRSLHDIYATHTIYNKSSPAVESDLQILVSNLSGATLLSWLTLGKQAQILLQRFKWGFDSAGTAEVSSAEVSFFGPVFIPSFGHTKPGGKNIKCPKHSVVHWIAYWTYRLRLFMSHQDFFGHPSSTQKYI